MLSHILLDMVGCLLTEPVITWCLTRISPMRREGLFWLLRMGILLLVMAPTRSVLPPAVSTLFGFVPYVVLPLAFYAGSAPRRLLAAANGVILVLATEYLAWSMGYLGLGLQTFDYASSLAHPAEYGIMHLLYDLIALLVAQALRALMDRTFRGTRAAAADEVTRRFAAFPLMQALLLVATVGLCSSLRDDIPLVGWSYYLLGGAAVMCLTVDVVLYASIRRFRDAQLADQRAQALEGQLEKLVAQYDGVVRSVVAASRVRHDARNQLAVARALAERGDAGLARAHVAELRGQLARAEGRELQDQTEPPAQANQPAHTTP